MGLRHPAHPGPIKHLSASQAQLDNAAADTGIGASSPGSVMAPSERSRPLLQCCLSLPGLSAKQLAAHEVSQLWRALYLAAGREGKWRGRGVRKANRENSQSLRASQMPGPVLSAGHVPTRFLRVASEGGTRVRKPGHPSRRGTPTESHTEIALPPSVQATPHEELRDYTTSLPGAGQGWGSGGGRRRLFCPSSTSAGGF